MRKLRAALTGLSMLAACGEPQQSRTIVRTPLDATLQAEARRAIGDNLRDPGSATYRNYRGYSWIEIRSVIICVDVNSRNGFGGMTGFETIRAAIDIDAGSVSVAEGAVFCAAMEREAV